MHKIIISITLLFFNSIYSQNDTINNYFTSYDEKIIFGFAIQQNSDTFYLAQKQDDEIIKTELTPNIERKLNINFTYKLIDFSIGTSPHFLKTNLEQKKSRNLNLGFRFNHKKWTQTITFINQKGFHIDINNSGKQYYSALRSTKIGGTTSYTFNDKFSYKTVFNQIEWQKRSAGSFIPHFSFYYTNIRSKEKTDNFYVDIYTITISPSYYYNFVVSKKILLGAGLNLGLGTNIVNKTIDPLIEVSSYLKMGYNTESFFGFIGFNTTSFAFDNKKESYNNTLNSVKLDFGYRFNTPKKLKKVYDDALEYVPVKL